MFLGPLNTNLGLKLSISEISLISRPLFLLSTVIYSVSLSFLILDSGSVMHKRAENKFCQIILFLVRVYYRKYSNSCITLNNYSWQQRGRVSYTRKFINPKVHILEISIYYEVHNIESWKTTQRKILKIFFEDFRAYCVCKKISVSIFRIDW